MAVAPPPLCPPVSSTVTVKAWGNEVIPVLDVKNALKNTTRKTEKLQRQAGALTMELLVELRTTACRPRRGRGGELAIVRERLLEHDNHIVLGDKAYASAPVAEELRQHNRIRLLTKPRNSQIKLFSASVRRLYSSVRQIFESVTSQLSAQFSIDTNHAHTFWGLCGGLNTKLTAHTLCI